MTRKNSDDNNRATRSKSSEDEALSEASSGKSGVGIFESFTLLLSAIGALEFGFTFTTLLCEIIMTVAFAQMVSLHRHKGKEVKIVFKSWIIEWYFFFCFEFALIPKTWLTLSVL